MPSAPAGAGTRPARILRRGLIAGLVAGLTVVAGIELKSGPLVQNERAYWRVDGPPCNIATEAELASIGRPLSQEFQFETLRFSRVSGAVICSGLTDKAWFKPPRHYDVCQFSRPRALTVEVDGRPFRYVFDQGQRATIVAAPATASGHSFARCIAAAHFNGE